MIHNLLDFIFDPLLLTMGVLFVLALIYHHAPRKEFYEIKSKIALPISVVLLIINMLGFVYVTHGGSQYWRGLQFAYQDDWQSAREHVCQAYRENPNKTFYGFQCSLTHAILAYQNNDEQALRAALEIQQQALDKDPYWYLHWANLASYEWALGEHDLALDHMRKAADMAPNMTFLDLNLGWMEEQSGFQQRALKHYQSIACKHPSFLNSVYAKQTLFRQQMNLEKCPSEYANEEENSYESSLRKGTLALDVGDLATAEEQFKLAIQESPHSSVPYTYLAFVQQRKGNEEKAWNSIQTSLFVNESSTWTNLIASQIAREQGKVNEELEYLYHSYQLYSNPVLSRRPYLGLYRGVNLPTDRSPFLVESGPPAESYDLFLELVDQRQRQGEIDKAREVSEWLVKIRQR
jgi:tetratricopeptide (TPR) repeat protein